jgi:hypothetical protein
MDYRKNSPHTDQKRNRRLLPSYKSEEDFCMKKLIAIAVVFALVTGAVFAVDLSGTVFGHVNLLEGNSVEDSKVGASGAMDRIRLEGSGENDDGTFGGWLRVDPPGVGSLKFNEDTADEDDPDTWFSLSGGGSFQGIAWWKPIDMLKVSIGGNSDGIWGKEGVTGWMFNQMPYDSGIALGTGNIWGWGFTVSGLQTRFAFFNGFDGQGLMLDFTPMDMLGIYVAIPYIAGGTAKDVYKATKAQVDLNFDFGNIALTYDGGGKRGNDQGSFFAYFGLTAIENFGLDVGLGLHLQEADANLPIYAGLGVKYAMDAFGIKLRTALGIPLEDTDGFAVLVDVLPYFAISDNLCAFLNAGVGITAPSKATKDIDDDAKSVVGWFVNPYLRVGAECGPTFYAGFQLWADGTKTADDKAIINWAIPVSIMVSF